MKNSQWLFPMLMGAFMLFGFAPSTIAAEPVAPWEAHTAVVKIYTYGLGEDYSLQAQSTGSGVIVNEDGLILTNRHVVQIENHADQGTTLPSVYMVCLTNEIGVTPDCSFIAKMVAVSNSRDLALLKIVEEEGFSKRSAYPYFKIDGKANTDLKIGDDLTILGYPGVGGPTITITEGTVNGKFTRFADEWIKTDADISFGNSGGAAIDASGNLVAIPTELSRDNSNELGYLLSLQFAYSWILSNEDNAAYVRPSTLNLYNQLLVFGREKIALRDTSQFERKSSPAFSLKLPVKNWEFDYIGENLLVMTDPQDRYSGQVVTLVGKATPDIDINNLMEIFNNSALLEVLPPEYNVVSEKTVEINGVPAKKVKYLIRDTSYDAYIVPAKGHTIMFLYRYGTDNQDRSIVEEIIQSFTLDTSSLVTSEEHEFIADAGNFSFRTNNEWIVGKRNVPFKPVILSHSQFYNSYVTVRVINHSDASWFRDNTNEDVLDDFIGIMAVDEDLARHHMSYRVIAKDPNLSLSPDLTNVMYFRQSMWPNAGEALGYEEIYLVNSGEFVYIITLEVFDNDIGLLNRMSESLRKQLFSWRWGSTPGDFPADSLAFEKKTVEIKAVNQASDAPVAKTQDKVQNNGKFTTTEIKNKKLLSRLSGKIILKVEENGEAFYLNPKDNKRYFLGRPEDAFSVMREQGIGIANKDLNKIAISTEGLTGVDSDKDGLPDLFEDAVGLDKNKADSDNNGVGDKEQFVAEQAKLSRATNFVNEQKGKIFLQVEGNGEAWYMNPATGERHFLGRPVDAFAVMRQLGLGITDNDFNALEQS